MWKNNDHNMHAIELICLYLTIFIKIILIDIYLYDFISLFMIRLWWIAGDNASCEPIILYKEKY